MSEKLISVKEFATRAGVIESTVYNWIKVDFIKSVTKQRGMRKVMFIPESELKKINT